MRSAKLSGLPHETTGMIAMRSHHILSIMAILTAGILVTRHRRLFGRATTVPAHVDVLSRDGRWSFDTAPDI